MSAARSLAELIDRARKGDREAWAELYVEFLPQVSAVARAHSDCMEDAEDVAMTVLGVELFRELRS